MVGGVVSVATGVMNPLIGKLTALMGDEYKKLKGVRRQASFLEKEFSAMNAALHKLELMDELDPAVKDWRDHVREMSYDVENCIDDFMRQFGREDAKAGFVKRTARHLKRLRQRHQIAARIEELKTLAIDANARRERYKIDDWKPSSGSVVVDPRLRAVYQEGASLVGIDGPMEELASFFMDTKKKLEVLSIVGSGGIGKTTLAKQLYDKFRGQFHCEAFFSVSQKPDMKVLLNRLEAKLDMTQSYYAREIEDIIEDIREHLKNKRYLIVVDDLWDQSVWNVISRAFPNEANGSRVIVTTRVEGVAGTACHSDHECIYRLNPLNELNSRMLFFNRVFGSGDGCPSYDEEVSADILKKCGGLPLAIITIASLIASEKGSMSGWEHIRSSLGVRSTINPTLEDMKNILNLSYMHLPLHLRACFLYLGMYPEDEEIWMSVVIREWVAEGLVSNLHGRDLMDVGKSYFNELINRNMIQPGITVDGELLSCRLHDIMLDLILRKCEEDNFLSVASTSEDITRLQGCKYKVRRLSLRSMDGSAPNGLTIGASLLSQVRSCAWTREFMPPLSLFKYLRVLTLYGGFGNLTIDLTVMNQLFQLRYLRVEAVFCAIELPCAMKDLVYLETLHLDGCLKNSIPSDMVHLPCLSYLHLPRYAPAIQGVENMKSLRNLHEFDLDNNSVKEIMGLGELTNLRELSFCGGVETSKVDALVSSVGKLCNLTYLHMDTVFVTSLSYKLGLLSSSPFKHIEILLMGGWLFLRVPAWMGDLHCLRVLNLYAMETSNEEFHVLGKLPSLISLKFLVGEIAAERVVFGKGVFPVLEQFQFLPWNGDVTALLVFEEGAMPKVRALGLEVNEWGGSTPVGMEHLIRLERIYLSFGSMFSSSSWIEDDVVSAFTKAIVLHPNRPSISMEQFLLPGNNFGGSTSF
uniref:Uncharacterized protein n=1 Tax=Avena sativa TaxID=4498 RepID=A0ACD5TCC5_AVESA